MSAAVPFGAELAYFVPSHFANLCSNSSETFIHDMLQSHSTLSFALRIASLTIGHLNRPSSALRSASDMTGVPPRMASLPDSPAMVAPPATPTAAAAPPTLRNSRLCIFRSR